MNRNSRLILAGILVISLAVTSFLGISFYRFVYAYGEKSAEKILLNRAMTTAALIDTQKVQALEGNRADEKSAEFSNLHTQLASLRRIHTDLRFVYVMKRHQDQIIFLVDAEPQQSKNYSAPGDVYDEASPNLHRIFRDKKPFIEGPLTDAWGRWISAHAPILEPMTGETIAVIGLNVDAAQWENDILFYKFVGASTPLIMSIVIIVFSAILFKVNIVNVRLNREIFERKRAEAALRESEESMRAILSASPDPLVIYNSTGEPQYVNPAFTDIFAWKLEELKGRRIPFVPEDQKKITMEAIREIYRTGATSTFETKRYTRDGRTLDVIVSAAVFKGPDGIPVGMVVNLTDISERKALQAQYEQAKKMEAIGTLAGGIAHDFNNLLMGIQGRASLLAFDLDPGHPHGEHITAIEDYVRSASNLTKQLLGFAQGGKYEIKPMDMNEVVHSTSTMFGRTRKQIRIHTRLSDPPTVVDADRGQIEQVLLNMYVNAWQAMPEGGELYLQTNIVTLDDQYSKSHLAAPGHYVKVSVTDTGIGMDAATRRRIFDPFFSTKALGRGTGLGLASAYGIVKNHGGMITVYSEKGHGTTFNIYLPHSDKTLNREVSIEGGLFRGSERILLVDDEEQIIDVGQAMLEKLGYQVLVAKGGRQAIEAIMNTGDPIDLVILDLIMPEMDGGKTFDRIREIQPGMPVILSSGYTINGQANEILQRGGKGFIQKPFTIRELSRKIRMVLDEEES